MSHKAPQYPCTVNLIHIPSLQRIPISTSHEIHPQGATRITPTALAGYIDDIKTYTSWTSPQSVITLHSNFITILCILTVLGLSVDFTKCVHALHKMTQWHFPPISPRPQWWRHCEPLWTHEVAGHHLRNEMNWCLQLNSKLLFNEHIKAAAIGPTCLSHPTGVPIHR